MIVVLKDKTEMVISSSQAEAVKQELTKPGDNFIEINGQMIRKSRIVELRTGGVQESWIDQVNEIFGGGEVLTEAGCRGQQSIQLEINNIAKAEGKGWQKLIGDRKWRSETRKKLIEADPEKKWCDYKSGTCGCEAVK